MTHRTEKEIFNELSKLCIEPGFIHAIAYFCFRDNTITYADEVEAKDMISMFSSDRLLRTEISTLIGLLVKEKIDFKFPGSEKLQKMIESVDGLLKEIHNSMIACFDLKFHVEKTQKDKNHNPFTDAKFLREPIFYGGESAYLFQYRDFTTKRYLNDNDWFLKNKGYQIADLNKVITCINDFQSTKLSSAIKELKNKNPEEWTILPGFEFAINDISSSTGIEEGIIENILDSFTLCEESGNEIFSSISDFNITNAYPLIKSKNNNYILFQQYSLSEAAYENPPHWFREDKLYNPKTEIRGGFTEELAFEELKKIFGENNVFSNVKIFEGKEIKGEIDVLVVFANRAIVVQAKSKTLTIEARKGNDNCLKNDFTKAIQKSYDQGLSCANLLKGGNCRLIDSRSNEITINNNFKEIYIFCLIADHYPALSFQSRQLLKIEQSDVILPPFVMDVFTLDAIIEMLSSPLYFLSYINRRVNYSDRVMATHELTILSYHLKRNLWISKEHDFFYLGDDISIDLDIAMMSRRGEMEGKKTPEGILTKFQGTAIGAIISQIEKVENHGFIDLGFMLLSLSEDAMQKINYGIETITNLSKKDNKCHDFSMAIDKDNSQSGLTIHCNHDSYEVAVPKLKDHCELRKYASKASEWFGLCIDHKKQWRFATGVSYEWKQHYGMDGAVGEFKNIREKSKMGRNDQCHCGSGIKYKKCCLS